MTKPIVFINHHAPTFTTARNEGHFAIGLLHEVDPLSNDLDSSAPAFVITPELPADQATYLSAAINQTLNEAGLDAACAYVKMVRDTSGNSLHVRPYFSHIDDFKKHFDAFREWYHVWRDNPLEQLKIRRFGATEQASVGFERIKAVPGMEWPRRFFSISPPMSPDSAEEFVSQVQREFVKVGTGFALSWLKSVESNILMVETLSDAVPKPTVQWTCASALIEDLLAAKRTATEPNVQPEDRLHPYAVVYLEDPKVDNNHYLHVVVNADSRQHAVLKARRLHPEHDFKLVCLERDLTAVKTWHWLVRAENCRLTSVREMEQIQKLQNEIEDLFDFISADYLNQK